MTPLKNILCPVDFTANSNATIEKASFLARLFQADLTLLHVISLPTDSVGLGSGTKQLVEEATQYARELMRNAKREHVPYAVTCKSSIRVGGIADEIIAEAKKLESDLIVMAARPVNSNRQSLTAAIVRLSDCPVLAYQPQKASDGEQLKGFRKILIPVEPDMGLQETRMYIGKYLSFMSPEMILVAIVNPETTEEYQEEVRQYLEAEALQFHEPDFRKISCKVILGNLPVENINRLAHAEGCDLIIIQSAHGRQDTDGDLLSPFASNLVNSAPFPVMALRAQSLEEA